MDPILLDFIQQVSNVVTSINPNTISTPGDALVQADDQIKTIVKTFVDKYRDDPSVSPQTLTQIKNLSNLNRVTRFLDVSKIVSEASKVGVPTAEVAAVVEEALATEAPIASLPTLQRLPAEIRELQFTSPQASTITPSAFTSAPANVQMPSIPRPPGAPATASAFRAASMGGSSSVTSSVLPKLPSAVNLNAGVSGPVIQAESAIAQAESQAASVSPTVARSLTQTIMGAGSSALAGLTALGARLRSSPIATILAVGGTVAAVGGALWPANNPSETPPAPKPAPAAQPFSTTPIGPPPAPTGPSADDLEYQKLLEQVNSMPENAGKYQAMGTLIVRRLTALESRRKELQTKLDSLDPTNPLQKDAYASTALLLRDTLTSIDKENDNWAKNEGLKRDQAKADLASSPDNLDLEKRAREAAIASANASAAASQSAAANSAMQRAVSEFNLDQARELAPTVKAKAEAELAAAQLNLQVAEATLHRLQAEALQKDTVEGLTNQYNNGELTYEQYAEQVLTASGKVEELIRFRTEMLKDKHAREQEAIQQGNWEKSFGLQQQQADLAAAEAAANAEFRKSQEKRAQQAQLMQGAAKVEELRAQQKRDYQNAWNSTTFLSESNLNNLKSFQTPMAAEQVATISGMDVNSPEFQKIYGIYSQMLASGPQNANTPAQPSGPQPAPSPAPSRPAPSTVTPQAPSFSQALAGMAPAPSPAPTPAPLVPMNMGPFTNALAAR